VARNALLECVFLIPLRRDRSLSDGKPHSKEAWLWLDEQLELFGGASRHREPVEGFYIDPDTGKRVRDVSRRYFVAVARQQLFRLRSTLSAACNVFQQKCIYLSIAGHVEFVKGPVDEER
jgi:hypothetical protein